ncbi:MAG TPA: hypothetical protein DCQ64_05870, partial [Candidatus Rokubacteria bacterium]|nr:hypothetical protein [Candidatus Rokubacteria bacterium]
MTRSSCAPTPCAPSAPARRGSRSRTRSLPAVRRVTLLAVAVVLAAVQTSHAGTLRTDLSKALVPLEEIVSGGPPPDGIPAIDRPSFVAPGAADAWLTPGEPVLALRIGGDARAYPLRILIWHEIVNDTVGG